jgi:DNA polymerase III delta prime subunit
MIILGSMVGLLAFCEYAENPRSYFSSYNDAKASGLMDAGWIPTYIPLSSSDIRETHNIDTNIVKMTFKYSLGDTKEIEENCLAQNSTINVKKYKCTYFGSDVLIELSSDGTGKLESHSK